MNNLPRLVGEKFGWYQWKAKFAVLNIEYNRKILKKLYHMVLSTFGTIGWHSEKFPTRESSCRALLSHN
jgi:hypothetical protein